MDKNLIASILIAIVVVLGLTIPNFVGYKDAAPQTPPAVTQTAPSEPKPAIPAIRPAHYDFLQLASFKTLSDAQSSLSALGKVLVPFVGANHPPLRIYKADLPNGTWFRVVMPTKDAATAQKLCSSMKAKGIDCLAISFHG